MLMLVVFYVSSSGFIIEKYFCSSCSYEHKDLVIIDVFERSTPKHECTLCVANHGSCSCDQKHDFSSTESKYFYLDLLYKSNNKNIELFNLVSSLYQSFFVSTNIFNRLICNIDLLSLPPPYKDTLPQSKLVPITILFSVFIL